MKQAKKQSQPVNSKPSEPDVLDSLISIKDAAAQIPHGAAGISANRLYFYCRSGRIGRKRLGRWMITSQELDWFIANGRRPIGRPPAKVSEGQRDRVMLALAGPAGLPARDRRRQALVLRYGLKGQRPATLQTIGTKLGVTRERARQLVTEGEKAIGLDG
jgi:hypothetical protein